MSKQNDTKEIQHSGIHKGRKRKRRIVPDLSGNAAAAIGEITKGCEIFGFTKGQFSIVDVIECLLSQIGPADAIVSTWTASGASIERAFRLFESGDIRTCRFLFDSGFLSRQPEFCESAVRRFGHEAIRTVKNHAKFIVLTNDEWSIVVRTSMNLNSNPRLENFEISDDPDLAAFFADFVGEIFERFDPDDNFSLLANGGLDAIGNGEVSEADLLAALE